MFKLMLKNIFVVCTLIMVQLISFSASAQVTDNTENQPATTNTENQNTLTISNAQEIVTPTEAPKPKAPVELLFSEKDKELKEGEIISNMARVNNNSDQAITFYLELDYPKDWKNISKTDKEYTLNPGDSVFIPIRLVPKSLSRGAFKFMINAFVISNEDKQVAFNFFTASTVKRTSWDLTAGPTTKIYFKNGEHTAPFNFNLLNTGPDKQEILFTLINPRANAIITDTNDNIVRTNFTTLRLETQEDTTLYYKYKYAPAARNFQRVDLETHRPFSLNEEQEFTLYANSTEPKQGPKNFYRKGSRINFVKLTDNKKVNPYGSAYLPLIADLNVNNIFGSEPITMLNLRGNTELSQNASLSYFGQINYSSNFYNKNLQDNGMYYVGYFHRKGSIQVGNITGGAMGIPNFGRGIKADYFVHPRHRVGAFFVKNPHIFKPAPIISYGVFYEVKYYKNNKAFVQYARSTNNRANLNIDAINFRTNYNFIKGQTIGINAALTNASQTINNVSSQRQGYLIRANYTGNFIQNRLNTNHVFGFNNKDFAISNFERIFYNHRSRFVINDKWNIMMINASNKLIPLQPTPTSNLPVNTTIFNQVNVGYISKLGIFQPIAFYNISDVARFRWHYRGLGLIYNTYDLKENLRVALNLRGGYNDPIDVPNVKEYFSLQANTLVFYRMLTLNARYFYGPNSVNDHRILLDQKFNPQSVFVSLQHQYVFPNTRFVMMNGINYSYVNFYQQHNVALFPELYYYTVSGWRFKVNVNYNIFTSGNRRQFYNNVANMPALPENNVQTLNQSYNFGVGVRKEFGIPIPFLKKRYADVEFVAFLDVNGNGEKDKGEQVLENVVIKYGDFEVITNEKGEALMQNYALSTYRFSATPLVPLDGWFCSVGDSVELLKRTKMPVPFVRGVKVKGKVTLDREALAADADKAFDLSRIKIMAQNGKVFSTLTEFDGSFEFFLPYGKYTITMDENVLSEKFILTQNNIELDITGEAEGLYVSFFIVEKKRKVVRKKFGSDGAN